MNSFFDLIPGWMLALIAGGIVFLVFRYFGLKAALAAAGTLLLALVFKRGRDSGRADQKADTRAADDHAVADKRKIDVETSGLSDAELDKENEKWLRR